MDAATAAAVALFVVYVLTLAPDVTFWDAGEFIAAARTLGIPHPPGTPLFVLLENVWAKLLLFLPFAVATNLFSAFSTALAAGLTGRLVQRATGRGVMAISAALAAGGMSSVWLNATETEVYAASLALGVLMIWVGERAGRADRQTWIYLLAYLIALAVPLHLSALVAAPAAILLAAYTQDRIRWPVVGLLGGVLLLAMGVGRMSVWMCTLAALVVVASVMFVKRNDVRIPVSALSVLVVAGLAFSALAFLYLRAQFDPGINQGNPDSLHALTDVVARRQYAVSPMWPREAPIWIQVANLGQYADWQVALSLGPTVLPSILRTLCTVIFIALGYRGAVALWRTNRRMGLATLTLFVCGTLGVLVYLNLHAGPSIGYGILPDNTVREARERDYFFVFAFWAWGVWAGIGAISFASRIGRPAWAGVLIACLPIALNWRAVTRRREPEQSLPPAVAEALLQSAPRDAVLFVVGDNDSYPLWYAQRVRRLRPDVAVVTIPLLPTEWYRSELSRRHFLLTERDVERFEGKLASAAAIADAARRLGRPVAAAITLSADERTKIGRGGAEGRSTWTASGLVYVEGVEGGRSPIDTAAARHWAAWVARRVPRGATRAAIDPINDYFRRVLDCPRQFESHGLKADSTRLDSVCNYR